MKKILLCPPTHYDIEYKINPWMDIENKVDQQKVHEEYQQLKQTYKDLGCEILEIPQEKDLPDMVYAANYGFPQSNVFIKSNFKFDERKDEAEAAKKYFEKLGFATQELPTHISFEGQGDLLVAGDKYLMGWGKRTDKEAKKYLEKILNVDITDFKMINPYYYHLDTCLLPINGQTIAINPLSFEQEGIEKLKKIFKKIIYVSKEDNAILACNACIVENTIVIGKGISQQLKDEFKAAGYNTKEVDMNEYRKGGGSVKCLTLEFYQ
jgi:N-dimethylarginine dimethylaminohydrolase